jgi:hypothetical protein
MRRVVTTLLVAGAVIAVLPPFFTSGACTAEFDAASNEFERQRSELGNLTHAQAYLASRAIPYKVLTAERCASWPPRDVEVCPGGPLLLVALPVNNRICRYYRDESIRIQLGFNASLQLVRIQSDMSPFRMLKLPILGLEVDWAK